MEAIIERAAGLDVHQGSVVACVILGAAGRRPAKEVRSFGTMRQDLAVLREWLLEKGVTHVGMEGTGVYWQPVHAALEGAFTLIVGNASHMHNVPGRRTDVNDAEWIADLVRHGLVRASFVPPPEVRVLRELVRHRKATVGTMMATYTKYAARKLHTVQNPPTSPDFASLEPALQDTRPQQM